MIDDPLTTTNYRQPPAPMFEACATGIRCEPGSYCNGTTCLPQGLNGNTCMSTAQCNGGYCRTIVTNVKVCDWARVDADDATNTFEVAPFCYFPLPDDLHEPSP
jgi:hypothetical protein